MEAIVDAVDELLPRRPRRRARLPAGRARNSRRRRGAAQAPSAAYGNPAAVRAPFRRRAGARVPHLERATHRARDERRGNLADGAGHPLRGRHGPRAREALFVSEQGRAVAGRGGLAGRRESAGGALRARGGRHLHSSLRRERLSEPRALYRSGDFALVAGVGDSAHEVAASDRDRDVSVYRAAARPRDRRRLSTAERTRVPSTTTISSRRSAANSRVCRWTRASAG